MFSNFNIPNFNRSYQGYRPFSSEKTLQEKVVRTKANIQDKLKTIAVVSMILDHIGFFFWPKIEVLRVIGRLAMPIFCFFAGYNFVGKRRSILLKYGFLLTVISYINSGFFPTLNILITIYLGQLYLQKFFTLTQDFVSNLFQILPLILFTPATFLLFDYGTLAISLMTLGYMYKHTTPKKSYIFLVAALTVVNTQILFWFDLHNFILLIIMCIILYYCLASFDDYADPINDEFSLLVSRNSMFIYFFHVSAFTIIRMIYLLLKQANL